MFTFLGERWKDLFQADFEVLLYDLTAPALARSQKATGSTPDWASSQGL
jgi:hypothetical protein